MLQFLSRRTFTHSINTPKSRQSCSLSGAEFHLVSQPPSSAPHRICTLSGLQCFYAKNVDMVSTGPSTFVSFDSRTQAGELENNGESSLICSSSTPEGERGRGRRRENREREKRQADANHWFLSKGTYEEESKFPRAAGRIPHLITILAEWLRPKKSHRKEISLKKRICIGGKLFPP